MLKEFKDSFQGKCDGSCRRHDHRRAFGRSSIRWSTTSSCRSSVQFPAASTSPITSCRSPNRDGDVLAAAQGTGRGFSLWQLPHCVLNFLILAWIIFLMVKAVNKMRASLEKQKNAGSPLRLRADVKLLTEIRDLLAKRKPIFRHKSINPRRRTAGDFHLRQVGSNRPWTQRQTIN